MDELVCSRCHCNKPPSEFYRDKWTSTGYTYRCKICSDAKVKKKRAAKDPDYLEKRRELQRKRRAQYPGEDAATTKAYRERHPENVIETRQKFWRSLTPEEREAERERLRTYKAANPEHVRAVHTEWRQENTDKITTYYRRRRARKAEAPRNDLTEAQWQLILLVFQHRCAYCGVQGQPLEQDHISPVGPEGSHTLQNIVPACHPCNAKKGRKGRLRPVQPLLL